MAKYAHSKQVIGISAPSEDDPRFQGVKGYWAQNGWNKGYFVDYTYADGTVETRFFYEGDQPGENHPGVLVQTSLDAKQQNDWLEDQAVKPTTPRDPDVARRTQQEIAKEEEDARERQREREEKEKNQKLTGHYETDAQKFARERQESTEARAVEDQERQRKLDAERLAAQARQDQLAAGQLDVSRGNLTIAQQREAREANEPKFLSQAGEDNPYLVRYNPTSGQIEQLQNPNYDAVKEEGKRLQSLLSTQIAARQVTLEEAKQRYTQWFDSNVKTPLMLAQEAREKAAEQRQALEADERRRQFAADFGLRKATLGQQAGEAAMQAEQSLLPYRAGPTEAAEMSSAINSLAAGGSMSTNASAGIHFTPGAFEFNAPDFGKIAKEAAKRALSGLTDYRPSDKEFATGDYSSVPAVNTGGAPEIPSGYGDLQGIVDQLKKTYSFGGASQ
jgi:hypothetical protein